MSYSKTAQRQFWEREERMKRYLKIDYRHKGRIVIFTITIPEKAYSSVMGKLEDIEIINITRHPILKLV